MSQPDKTSALTNYFKGLKTALEFLVTLAALPPLAIAVWQLLQEGFKAVIPAWLILIPTGICVCLGYLLWQKSKVKYPEFSYRGRRLLESVGFDYTNSPANNGWDVSEAKDGVFPRFTHFLDGFFGSALKIELPNQHFMDYHVQQGAKRGSYSEFTLKLSSETVPYICVTIQSNDTSKSRTLWLRLGFHSNEPFLVSDGNGNIPYEYEIPTRSMPIDGGWSLIRVDLREAVAKTAQKDGWKFIGLECFRLRGNLSIARIEIFE